MQLVLLDRLFGVRSVYGGANWEVRIGNRIVYIARACTYTIDLQPCLE